MDIQDTPKKRKPRRKMTEEEKEKKKPQLALARARAVAVLDKRSPRARGDEKTKKVLEWLYRWGWASPSTVEKIGGAKRAGLVARLEKNGLVITTRTASGGGVKDIPAYLVTLSKSGLEEQEKNTNELLPYDLDPYKIRQDHLRHDQLAQSSTLNALIKKSIIGYQTEKELAQKSMEGVKQPDILWILPDGRKCAIEIEMTAKWKRDLDQFVYPSILSIQKTKDKPARFDQIFIVSDSPRIIERYKAAFAPGSIISIWEKDNTRHWKEKGKIEVQNWVKEKIQWKLLKS